MSVLVEKTNRGNSSRVAYPSKGRLKARQVVNGICRSLQPSVVLQKPGYHFFSSGLKLVQQWCDRWSLHRHISIVGLSLFKLHYVQVIWIVLHCFAIHCFAVFWRLVGWFGHLSDCCGGDWGGFDCLMRCRLGLVGNCSSYFHGLLCFLGIRS